MKVYMIILDMGFDGIITDKTFLKEIDAKKRLGELVSSGSFFGEYRIFEIEVIE